MAGDASGVRSPHAGRIGNQVRRADSRQAAMGCLFCYRTFVRGYFVNGLCRFRA
ncbi:hypothetical protein AERO8C_30077 [Aeromonas veronii]|uniref:Uncharacterized protein n=1 Tax=Aeromonas veronii TaxID=654 RepID=A0A653L6X0_AERVE|nr:hypothetical protein AERO8C_30077 [Aeromonas veronii]